MSANVNDRSEDQIDYKRHNQDRERKKPEQQPGLLLRTLLSVEEVHTVVLAQVRGTGEENFLVIHARALNKITACSCVQSQGFQRSIIPRSISASSGFKFTSGGRTGPPTRPAMSIIDFMAETS